MACNFRCKSQEAAAVVKQIGPSSHNEKQTENNIVLSWFEGLSVL